MRPFLSVTSVVCVFVVVACDSGDQAPDSHYSHLADHVNKGEVATAYSSFMPVSYDHALNDVLGQVREIVAEDEFGKLQTILKKAGAQIGGMVEVMATQEPGLNGIGEKLKDPLALLGIKSYDAFKSATIMGVVTSLQDNLLKNFLTSEHTQKKLGKIEFSVEEKDGTNRLTSTTTMPDGKVEKSTLVLQEIDGKWVPKDLVEQWAQQISELSKVLDEMIAEKKKDPEAFKAKLHAQLAKVEQLLGAGLGMFGGLGGVKGMPGGLPEGLPGTGSFPGGLPLGDK